MNPIFQALDQGHEPDEIMKYISKVMPKLIPKIQKAISNGYSLNNVLGFLAKTSVQDSRGMSESQLIARNRQIDSQLAQKGLMAAGALVASPIAASVARSAFARALPGQIAQGALNPNSSGSTPADISQTPQSISPQAQGNQPTTPSQAQTIQISSSQPPINQPSITQTQAPIQPEVKTIDVKGLLEKSGLKKHVDELSQRTKDPKQIAALLYSKYPKEMKQLQAEAGKNMEDAIGDYLGESKLSSTEELIEKPTPEQQPKIEKSSIVASPNGIGEVKAIRNGEALIDVDGKLHKAKEEELIQSPLPEKDLAALYNELVRGIEKKHGEISKNVYWAGYDPNTNELAYLPHDGGLYVYDDISPEDAKELTNILAKRKTTGENYIGVWNKNTSSPIGAQMSKLIQRLQDERGGKGNEYSNKFLRIYDALEPAKSAAKEKYKEEKKQQQILKSEKRTSVKEPKKQKESIVDKMKKDLEIAYEKLLAHSEKIRLENRSGKINVDIRSQDIKKGEALQKRVDDLRNNLVEEENKEYEKKTKKPRID